MQGIDNFHEKSVFLLLIENVERPNGERLNSEMLGVCIPIAGAVCVLVRMYQL